MGDRIRDEHREASELLDREWDLLGVYQGSPEEQAPPGEYETYAGWVVAALRSGAGRPEVLRLMWLARHAMGLSDVVTMDERAADRLFLWWNERTH